MASYRSGSQIVRVAAAVIHGYDLFSRGNWDWDDLGKLLLALLLVEFAPAGVVWLAVDDTLCHKRGKRVALGGIFLDPVLSSKSRKVFRYAVNYFWTTFFKRPFTREHIDIREPELSQQLEA